MTKLYDGMTKQTDFGMKNPISFSAPLRRIVVSENALASAFRALSRNLVCPDLRANAFGLGIEAVSAIARNSGCQEAVLSEADANVAGLEAAPPETESSASWLLGSGVLSFEAEVISVKQVSAGARVSYGHKFITKSPTTLALVGAGFADGVPRSVDDRAKVRMRNELHPIAGVIAMDQLIVDVGNSEVQLGDVATIWGESPSLANWSDWSGRPAEMLVSQINRRVEAVWS